MKAKLFLFILIFFLQAGEPIVPIPEKVDVNKQKASLGQELFLILLFRLIIQ